MEQIIINKTIENQRIDKFLKKYLPNAGMSFLYKMLRKKNIVLNKKKATGKEILKDQDVVTIFFSDETLLKFKTTVNQNHEKMDQHYLSIYQKLINQVPIVFESKDILILNKPSGLLSQKAEKNDLSINEYAIGYLIHSKQLSSADFRVNKPSICNRLDRNTSGLILFGKTLQGLQILNELIKNHSIEKYYRCILYGKLDEPVYLNGYLEKNNKNNTVSIKKQKTENASKIETEIVPIAYGNNLTYAEIKLITGKTHQIRAHVSSIGHPIIGDYKYGMKETNQTFKENFGIRSQLLHAYRIVFPTLEKTFSEISEKEYIAELPIEFKQITDTYFKKRSV